MPHHHAYWYKHHNNNRMFMCGPSRLVWFGIGSIATWAWIHHRHNHDHPLGGPWGHHRRVDYRAGEEDAPEYQQQQQQHPLSREWPAMMRPGPRLDAQEQAAPAAPGGAGAGSAGGPGQREPAVPALADQDLERLRQFGRNAEETVRAFCGIQFFFFDQIMGTNWWPAVSLFFSEQISGMSEATIDSMMGALQGLKDVRLFKFLGVWGHGLIVLYTIIAVG
jgi:hypothetical protein